MFLNISADNHISISMRNNVQMEMYCKRSIFLQTKLYYGKEELHGSFNEKKTISPLKFTLMLNNIKLYQ